MLSARGRHELHARVLNHWFTREASCPLIVQMLATCPHNLSKDAIATSARELYQSVEDGYPLIHTASRYKDAYCYHQVDLNLNVRVCELGSGHQTLAVSSSSSC